jgi:hypothetical protein
LRDGVSKSGATAKSGASRAELLILQQRSGTRAASQAYLLEAAPGGCLFGPKPRNREPSPLDAWLLLNFGVVSSFYWLSY